MRPIMDGAKVLTPLLKLGPVHQTKMKHVIIRKTICSFSSIKSKKKISTSILSWTRS